MAFCRETHGASFSPEIPFSRYQRQEKHFGVHQSFHSGWRMEWLGSSSARVYEPFSGDITNKCSECGVDILHMEERNLTVPVNRETIHINICDFCAYWLKLLLSDGYIIKNKFYNWGIIDEGHNKEYSVKQYTGRVATGQGLWFFGNVPTHFRKRFTDNAEFIE